MGEENFRTLESAITRRTLLQSSVAAAAVQALRGQSAPRERPMAITVTPAGELAEKLGLAARRFESGTPPPSPPNSCWRMWL